MTSQSISVCTHSADSSRIFKSAPDPRSVLLAQQTGLPLIQPAHLDQATFYLFWQDNHLTLCDQSTQNSVDVCIDFCSGKNAHRLRFGGSYGQPLARAISAKPDSRQLLCDATGGLGRDAFVFASLGCDVVILERSGVIFSLLQDGLARARKDHIVGEIAQRMAVYQLDSQQLPQCWPLNDPPDTVYLDPMYPHNSKSAAAKKGMQTLQRLLPLEHTQARGICDQSEEAKLITAAITTATKRVVVKRPAKAPALVGPIPVGSIKSPNTRYDLYHPHPINFPINF